MYLSRQPNTVSYFCSSDEVKEAAEKVLLDETGLKVNVHVSIEDDKKVYLELHHNEEEVVNKLADLDFNVDLPAEDTRYLFEKMSGFDIIEYEYDPSSDQIEIRVPYHLFKSKE